MTFSWHRANRLNAQSDDAEGAKVMKEFRNDALKGINS